MLRVLRLLGVLLLAALLGSGGVAAGIIAGVPTIVQLVFVGSLALFIVTLTTGTLFARSDDGAPPGRAASVGSISPADDYRFDARQTGLGSPGKFAAELHEQVLGRNPGAA